MIPLIRDLSPESRDLLRRQIHKLFPESGIAGLYSRKRRSYPGHWRLEIHCGGTRRTAAIAHFTSEILLVRAMPLLVAQMNQCRAEHRGNKRARKAAA